jgi:uncharacterized protein with von Willebrand factor type A (vWA) domain
VNQEYLLQGLFFYLARAGFQLSVRDYQDALSALRAGYGLGTRADLLWLCRMLWARSNEELRLLDLLFQRFPFPSPESVDMLTSDVKEEVSEGRAKTRLEIPPSLPQETPTIKEEEGPAPGMQFAPPSQKGVPLTTAQAQPQLDEVFILMRRPIVSMRALTIAWRRFRATSREGPKVELDLETTIREQCRQGILTEPVLIPARRNQAKLIALLDVSNSMLPWNDFQQTIVESLFSGHLGEASVYYFHNVPIDVFYEKETLTKPVGIEKALKAHQSTTLLIFSDAGAGRGNTRRDRVEETREFLVRVKRQWQPIVWLNPMPPHRWRHTSAEKIAQLAHHTMVQANEEGLIRAVDVLRGKTLQ